MEMGMVFFFILIVYFEKTISHLFCILGKQYVGAVLHKGHPLQKANFLSDLAHTFITSLTVLY